MTNKYPTEESFLKDVENHQVKIINSNGVNRHIRLFSSKDPGNMWYDLTTWQGHICYSGDMGTYIFSRYGTDDMFNFFRRNELSINPSYWGEKLQAIDPHSGYKEYSQELFIKIVKENLEEYCEETEVSDTFHETCLKEMEGCVFYDSEFEYQAYNNIYEWENRYTSDNQLDKDITNYAEYISRDFGEICLQEYTYRYIWCLYAIVYGISKFDKNIEVTND